jgi:hypothetical protein
MGMLLLNTTGAGQQRLGVQACAAVRPSVV